MVTSISDHKQEVINAKVPVIVQEERQPDLFIAKRGHQQDVIGPNAGGIVLYSFEFKRFPDRTHNPPLASQSHTI